MKSLALNLVVLFKSECFLKKDVDEKNNLFRQKVEYSWTICFENFEMATTRKIISDMNIWNAL